MSEYNVRSLRIYQKAIALVVSTYKLTKSYRELTTDFSLCDQLKRASISVVANIAEGYYRTKKQSHNYLNIASGSTNEMAALLEVVNSIYNIDTSNLQEEYISLGKQINAYAKSF